MSKAQASHLSVIEGGGQPPSKLLDVPSYVLGRSPVDKQSPIGYRLSTQDIRKALSKNRRQPAYDMWACVVGQIPPQTGASLVLPDGGTAVLQGVGNAYACFRGILRPLANDGDGFDVFAFVHNPRYTYKYEPSMGSCVKLVEVPNDLVYVTHMKLDYPEGRPYGKDWLEKAPVQGIITHGGFVEVDPGDPSLPVNYASRFRKRMW